MKVMKVMKIRTMDGDIIFKLQFLHALHGETVFSYPVYPVYPRLRRASPVKIQIPIRSQLR